MKPRKPIRRKSSKQRAKELKDKQLKPDLLDRDGGCVMRDSPFGKCGGVLAAAHVLPKGTYQKLRHVPENLMMLCYRHHIHVWHKNPIEVTHWFEEVYPERAAYIHELKLKG